MEIITETLIILSSLAAMLFVAERLIGSSVRLASAFGVSPSVIGLTLLAYGTSLPEFAVSSLASLGGHSNISVSNVIGSNIYNISMVIGICSIISPIAIKDASFARRDGIIMLVSTFFLILVSLTGEIGRLTGFIMIMCVVYYTYYILKTDQSSADIEKDINVSRVKEAIMCIILLVATLLCGRLAVDHSVNLARLAGISEWIIGATVIAAGTSFPETVVSLIAIYRGQTGMSVGNIVGSNIFNILWILGFASLIRPLEFIADKIITDLGFLAVTAIFFYICILRGRILRSEGFVFIITYAAYIYYLLALHGS